MPRIGSYRHVGSGEKGALKSMVALRPQRVRQEYGRFVQCCDRQKARNGSNGIGGDFLLQPQCSLLSTETAKCFLISFLLLAGLSLDSNIFHTFITEEEGIHDL